MGYFVEVSNNQNNSFLSLLNVVSTSIERYDIKITLFGRWNDVVCRLGNDQRERIQRKNSEYSQ